MLLNKDEMAALKKKSETEEATGSKSMDFAGACPRTSTHAYTRLQTPTHVFTLREGRRAQREQGGPEARTRVREVREGAGESGRDGRMRQAAA